MSMHDLTANPELSFTTLINEYAKVQQKVLDKVKEVASRMSVATPGKFLLLQFGMSQVSQIGQSISNMVGQVQATIMNTIRNSKAQ